MQCSLPLIILLEGGQGIERRKDSGAMDKIDGVDVVCLSLS